MNLARFSSRVRWRSVFELRVKQKSTKPKPKQRESNKQLGKATGLLALLSGNTFCRHCDGNHIVVWSGAWTSIYLGDGVLGPAYLWVVSLKGSTLLGMMAMLEPKLLRVMVIFGTYLYFWGWWQWWDQTCWGLWQCWDKHSWGWWQCCDLLYFLVLLYRQCAP